MYPNNVLIYKSGAIRTEQDLFLRKECCYFYEIEYPIRYIRYERNEIPSDLVPYTRMFYKIKITHEITVWVEE